MAAWIGSALVGITSDRLGRKKAVALGAAVGVLGGVLMTAAAHVAMLIMGRLCVGFAVGTMTGVAPVFGAEIAKTHERARITACVSSHALALVELPVGEQTC